jgi:hypothetical protein
MRRLALSVLAAALPLALAAPASATFHMMKVSEVQLSSGGVQFVELRDDGIEPFPPLEGPYKLVVYGANGARLSGQTLATAPWQNNSNPHVLASDGSGDAPLTVTLPAGAGQVCFTHAGETETRVHCLAYGCPPILLSSLGGSERGSAPSEGQSLQRLGPSSLAIGAPTPGAANTASGSAACASPPAGSGGPGGGAGGAGDSAAPKLKLSAEGRQKVTKLAVAVRLNEAARLTVSATVNVPSGSRVLRFKTVKRQLKAGVRTTVRLKLSRKNLARVKRALRARRKLTAKVSLRATDAAGNRSKLARKSIRLR